MSCRRAIYIFSKPPRTFPFSRAIVPSFITRIPHSTASTMASNAMAFDTLQGKVDSALLAAIKDMKFESMSPVQEKVMSGLPTMDSDCLVQAKTGTGKTVAFLLPAIQNTILKRPSKGLVSVLVMSPTRELALQIAAEAQLLVSKLQPNLEVHTAFGGSAKASNLSKFQRGDPKILIATPGRLKDYLSETEVQAKFKSMKTLVLDEADRMLDQGFLPDILSILKALPSKASGHWQGMCFSATIPPKMKQVFSHVLAPNHTHISTIDHSEPPTLSKVPQFSIVIPNVTDTFRTLDSLLREEIKATVGEPKIIVFGITANLVALYAEVFENQLGLRVFELHSRLSQPARTRTTEGFKAAKKGIMFASDVIGRGMDFPDVSLVIQVGLPMDADAYTHRVGRTARAGKDGRAIILLTERESFYLKVNPQFPIQPYPASSTVLQSLTTENTIDVAVRNADPKSKQKAYSAYLGFMKSFMNKLKLSPTALVEQANQFALEGMLCDQVPEMEKQTIGKMGLKNVPGIRYASSFGSSSPGFHSRAVNNTNFPKPRPNGNKRPAEYLSKDDKGPSRRQRHQ